MKFTSRFIRVPRRRPRPCADTQVFVQRHGEFMSVDFPRGQTPRFPAPEPLFGELPKPLEFTSQVGLFDRRLAKLKDVAIWSNEGFLVAGNEVLEETCWGPYNLVGHPVSNCRLQPWPQRVKGEWFSCGLYWSTYYYHWICDVLPRFHGVLENIPSSVKFIIHFPLKEYETESLAAFGINPDRCFAHDGFRPLQPEVLYYATPVAMSGDHDPKVMRWVRQKILAYIFPQGIPRVSPGLRLYVSRSRTKIRRLVNEEALLSILEHYGFQIVQTEELSFREQVALFAKASVIVGPHGGGLTNMLWAPESCSVFEVLGPEITNRRFYWSLAHALNHRYYMGVGEAQINPGRESDLVIDPGKFESALRHILES